MKRLISIIAIACFSAALVMTSMSAQAQTPNWKPTGSYSLGSYPVFNTKNDTVVASATDTFWMHLGSGYYTSSSNTLNSLTFTSDIWKVAGTPTVTVACYASANKGKSYTSTAIAAYTVYPTNTYTTTATTTCTIINAQFGQNPYTDYFWVATPSAASTINWVEYGLTR